MYAHRPDMPRHVSVRRWIERQIGGEEPFGVAELVLSSFVRIVTNRRVFEQPTPLDVALEEVARIREQPNCVAVRPGPDHFGIFSRLCRESGATGKLVADAYFAALAIEHGCRWLTFDNDFRRFPGLEWASPSEG